MKAAEYLSVGTVVKLKGKEKRAVISGIRQKCGGEEFDYRAVPYPEGHVSDEGAILFQQTDIETIYMLGYTDQEREYMLKSIDGEGN